MVIKRKCIFNFLLFLFMLSKVNAQQAIEGLSYLDKKPVSVVKKDGKIIEVKKIARLSEKNKNLYIAHGLIDTHANGFDGISFTSESTEGDASKVTRQL